MPTMYEDDPRDKKNEDENLDLFNDIVMNSDIKANSIDRIKEYIKYVEGEIGETIDGIEEVTGFLFIAELENSKNYRIMHTHFGSLTLLRGLLLNLQDYVDSMVYPDSDDDDDD